MAELTSDTLIIDRLDAGREFMKPYAERATRNCGRYLGSQRLRSTGDVTPPQDLQRDLAVGEVNYLAINIRQKVASIAIGNPDWIVKCAGGEGDSNADSDPDEDAARVREYLKTTFYENDVPRIGRRCLLMKSIGAQASVACLWDAQGFGVEFAGLVDLAVDPHVTDETWNRLRWGYRRIRVPLREAIARYGETKLNLDADIGDAGQREEFEGRYKKGVDVWCYWDGTTEAELFEGAPDGSISGSGSTGKKLLLAKRKNEYGIVPIFSLQGDHDPEAEFSLGDFDTSYGAAVMEKSLQNILNNQARNGGGSAWVRSEYVEDEQLEQWLEGELDGPLKVSGAPGDQATGYTPNQALNESVLHALAYVANGRDADQATTQYDRGIVQNPARTATEATLTVSRSTARGNQSRGEYERFLERIGWACVKFAAKFGLDPRRGEPGPDDIALHQALGRVKELSVIEESTAFKDPVSEKQAAFQFLTIAAQVFPMTLQTGKPLNLTAFVEDALRASNKRDVERYFLSQQETQALMEQMSQQAQQAQQQQANKPPKQPTETLNYKDAPPDIQRQIEAQAGLQPSGVGQTSEQLLGQESEAAQQHHDLQMQVLKGAQEESVTQREQMMQHAHEAEIAARQQGHEARLSEGQQQHDLRTTLVGHAASSQQQTRQHVAQLQQTRIAQRAQAGASKTTKTATKTTKGA